jgi:ubiquinone/menaquinone biosynthesis C-methylase UbiE
MTDDRRAETTAEVGEVWDASAQGWLRNADLIDHMSTPIRRWVVDHLDPQPGQTILELAAGGGDTGFEVAQKLGDDGLLITSDISQQMLDGARERAKQRGISNVEFRLIDAQRIDVEDASMDGVIHRYGPMLLPDADASFGEVRRVLRPTGSYLPVVWAGPDRNPWIMATGMSLMQNGVQPPGDPTGPGGMFSLADPEQFRLRIASAGFSDVQVETVPNTFDFASFADVWKIPSEIAGPIATIIATLEPEQVERIKETFKGMVEPFRDGEEYHLPAISHCVLAR